jgi:hypothetical protein
MLMLTAVGLMAIFWLVGGNALAASLYCPLHDLSSFLSTSLELISRELLHAFV